MKPILLLGEAWGTNEVTTQTPFVGASGIELLRMLDEAKIISLTGPDLAYIRRFWDTNDPRQIDMVWRLHPEVARANVFNFHPDGNDLETICGPRADAIPGFPALLKGKYCRAEFANHIADLATFIDGLDPNLIICLGNTPLWALAGATGITKLRGTTLLSDHTIADYKLLPTYHPAAVLRQWELRPVTVIDLIKARREAAFPEVRRPARQIWIEPTLEDLDEFRQHYLTNASLVAVDIETAGNQITCIGFAPSIELAIVIPFYDHRRKDRSYWSTTADECAAWGIVRQILEDVSIKKLFQNGLYDIAFLWRSLGIRVFGAKEDTMLCHHALQPESLKGLGFLGSIYCDEGAWKSERKHSTTIKRDE